ncbi:hypothetical protein ASF92_09760 [Pedobacter sp. Leaf176]|nr:hypothetical protein ASF92_09760 [Pedobacter sp. Leaf176]
MSDKLVKALLFVSTSAAVVLWQGEEAPPRPSPKGRGLQGADSVEHIGDAVIYFSSPFRFGERCRWADRGLRLPL